MDTSYVPSILCVDDDRDIAEVVQAILEDEGYRVSCLYDVTEEALLRAIGRLEPDVILLDGGGATEYGSSWHVAQAVRTRSRPVSTIMFTAHVTDVAEAQEKSTDRATAADFAAVVPKPFHLDALLEAVGIAAGRWAPFDRSKTAETGRTRALVTALRGRGATDINPSKMREWAMFRDRTGTLVQLHWWQSRGVYQVGRYNDRGVLVVLGQFTERDAALDAALPAGQATADV